MIEKQGKEQGRGGRMFVPGLQRRYEGPIGEEGKGLLLDREETDVAQRQMVICKGKMGNSMLG